jgi:Spy/CpxP family protein refolding chaperone
MSFTSRWVRSALFGLVGIVGLSGVALANRDGGGCRHGQPLKRMESRLDGIGLAPETLASARTLLDKAREDQRGTRDQLRDARDRMHELMSADKPDTEAVLAQADTIGSLETSAKKARLKTMLDLRALLTPDQWAQLQTPLPGEKDHHKRHHF